MCPTEHSAESPPPPPASQNHMSPPPEAHREFPSWVHITQPRIPVAVGSPLPPSDGRRDRRTPAAAASTPSPRTNRYNTGEKLRHAGTGGLPRPHPLTQRKTGPLPHLVPWVGGSQRSWSSASPRICCSETLADMQPPSPLSPTPVPQFPHTPHPAVAQPGPR